MGVTALTLSPQSQVIASLDIIAGAISAVITNVQLKPRVGPTQVLVFNMLIDGIADLELSVSMTDQAFEDVDLFGGKKGKGAGEGELVPGGRQG